MPEIDFQRIRPHRGTRHGGFEELTVQLLRADVHGGELTRIEGTGGDGGVEAFVILANQKETGLQAKYFDQLGSKQWHQISESVATAFENHPHLIEYRVAVPLDRTPAQKKKWDALRKQWRILAAKKGLRRDIKFVWWGASELCDLLTTPTHSSKLAYWFGCAQFSDKWIDAQNESAVADLDCRYTPKQHVRTESEQLVDAFSLTDSFIADYYSHVKAMFDAGRKLNDRIHTEKVRKEVTGLVDAFVTSLQNSSRELGDSKSIPSFTTASQALLRLEETHDKLICRLEELNRPTKPFEKPEERHYYQGPFSYELSIANRFEQSLRRLRSFLRQYVCADHRRLLVVGPAGSGKSHLLANAVLEARRRGQPALISLGEHFLASEEPWTQLLEKLGWEGEVTELLSALDHAGELCGKPALLCIDALNESSQRSLWRSHLNGFAKKLEPFRNVRLLISCRSDFVRLTLPDTLINHSDDSWAFVEHAGFGDELFEAVAMYFSGYEIQADHFPPLLEEFRNPLFLKTFCEAFENSRLPSDPVSLEMVMKRRISKVCEKLLRDIDCAEEITRDAIELIADAIEANQGRAVPKTELRPKIDALFPAQGESKSLYRHLKSNGLLVETGIHYGDPEAEAQVAIRFPYERFSDYFIAERMLRPHATVESLRKAWTRDGTLARINDRAEFWKLHGVLRALAILLPERFNIELVDLMTNRELDYQLYGDFLASLPWRSPKSFGRSSHKVLRAAQGLGLEHFLQAVLRVSTIPGHPYNADFLHERLKQMELARRDEVWTKEISKLTVERESSVPELIVKWAFHVPSNLVSDAQALLVGRVLAWFFSSNLKAFRFRSTVAAIRLLVGRCEQTAQLVLDFHDCNDPYVVERVFAVACGVAMREENTNALTLLAKTVYQTVFEKKTPPPHILIRDYAQCVLELAHHRNCLPEGVAPERFRPPYQSKWPRIWSEKNAKLLEKQEGWRDIKSSVQPECTGWYGDFGRYVMQGNVHQFSNVRLTKASTSVTRDDRFDAMTARRWILQRVKELGWTPERFEKYERTLPHGRQSVDVEELRPERIGKKYQWIALRELQGFLSDHYYLALDWGAKQPEVFEGAWQLWARDFDPSQPLQDLTDEEAADPDELPASQRPFWNRLSDPFADERLMANREAWVIATPGDFRSLIELPRSKEIGEESLALVGYYRWKEELPHNKAERDFGRLEMFAHIRSWLVRKEQLQQFLTKISGVHFWGHGCDLISIRRGWIGEYPWGAAHKTLRHWCEEQDDWIEKLDIPTVQTACHRDTGVAGMYPSPQVCETLGIRWGGKECDFVDEAGALVAFSPFLGRHLGSAPCIVSRTKLLSALEKSGWEIVWAVLGERHCWSSAAERHIVPKESQFSAVFHVSKGRIVGGITQHLILDIPRRAP